MFKTRLIQWRDEHDRLRGYSNSNQSRREDAKPSAPVPEFNYDEQRCWLRLAILTHTASLWQIENAVAKAQPEHRSVHEDCSHQPQSDQ
jgi:hypothetical protein